MSVETLRMAEGGGAGDRAQAESHLDDTPAARAPHCSRVDDAGALRRRATRDGAGWMAVPWGTAIHERRKEQPMTTDLVDLYRQASGWTLEKIQGAADQLDAATPCDEWDMRELLNHMLETQNYFLSSGRGEDKSPPGQTPPDIMSDDPVRDFETARDDIVKTYSDPAVIEKTGPALGIAFSDALVHGWDVARATGQDTTMPPGLAEVAYETIHRRFTDDQRKGVFKPELPVPAAASSQARLLAYTGRRPD
jgi:uncharacterized protein (TIGR03086 family)